MATRFRVYGVDYIFVDEGGGGGSVVPAPPAYNADLVTRGGVLMWRQHETAQASFINSNAAMVTWPTFGARPFFVEASVPHITLPDELVTVEIINVTASGCTIVVGDNITGDITINVWENL